MQYIESEHFFWHMIIRIRMMKKVKRSLNRYIYIFRTLYQWTSIIYRIVWKLKTVEPISESVQTSRRKLHFEAETDIYVSVFTLYCKKGWTTLPDIYLSVVFQFLYCKKGWNNSAFVRHLLFKVTAITFTRCKDKLEKEVLVRVSCICQFYAKIGNGH